MAHFDLQSPNGSTTYLGSGFPIYCFAKLVGDTDEGARRANFSAELWVYLKYRHTFSWGPKNSGTTEFTVNGSGNYVGGNLANVGSGGESHMLYSASGLSASPNVDGNFNIPVHIFLSAKHILRVEKGTYHDLATSLDYTFNNLPSVGKAFSEPYCDPVSVNQIGRHNYEDFTVTYGGFDGTYADPVGLVMKTNSREKTVNSNVGSGSGSFKFKPSDYGVGEASNLSLQLKRYYNGGGTDYYQWSKDQPWYKTYRLPKARNLKVPSAEYSVSTDMTVSFEANNRRWAEEQVFKETLILCDTSTYSDQGVTTTKSSSAQDQAGSDVFKEEQFVLNGHAIDYVMQHDTLTAEGYIDQYVFGVNRNESSGEKAIVGPVKLRIWFGPSKAPESLRFFRNSRSGPEMSAGSGISISKDSTEYCGSIYTTWEYKGLGKPDGYIVEILGSNKSTVLATYNVTDPNVSAPSSILPVGKMSYIRITGYNNRTRGQVKGPPVVSEFFVPYENPTTPSFSGGGDLIGMHNKCSIDTSVSGLSYSGSYSSVDATAYWYVGSGSYRAGSDKSSTSLSASSHPNRPRKYMPSSGGIGEAQNFTIKFTRSVSYYYYDEELKRERYAGGGTSSNSCGAKTYRVPKIRSLTVSPINLDSANKSAKFTWQTNGHKWGGSEEVQFATYLEASTDNYASTNTTSTPGQQSGSESYVSASTTVTRDYFDNHIPASYRNTQDVVTITFRARRRNLSASANPTSGGNIDAVSNTVTFSVRYVPNTAPSNVVFRRENSSGKIINPGDNIIITPESPEYVNNVYVSWDPVTTGVVDGYIIRVFDEDHKLMKSYDVSTTNVTIPHGDLRRTDINTIEITAYYKRPNGVKAEGPAYKSPFVLPLWLLNTPVVFAPTNGSEWINNSPRILFQLPTDPDWDYFRPKVKNSYKYKEIEIEINGKSYLFSNTKSAYSTSSLTTHKGKLVINPALFSGFPSTDMSYKIRIRVRKDYRTQLADDLWSFWSEYVTTNIVYDSFSVKRGDMIMADHRNTLTALCQRMKTTYPIPSSTIKTKDVAVGDMIKASDYVPPYQDIVELKDSINNYAPFDSGKDRVKLPSVPDFKPVVGEFITALPEDSSLPGRNYIWILHNYANLLI